MGFFKEFKDDFSDAVDEMITNDEGKNTKDDDMINTITESVDVDGELSKLDGLLERANERVSNETPRDIVDTVTSNENLENTISASLGEIESSDRGTSPAFSSTASAALPASDENAIITAGMTVTGDLDSNGSIEVQGRVNGNIRCNGKLTVTGMVSGNSSASEVFADAARVDGEINASGTVKVGAGSVVIGNVTASSAVIAGAVKGDIDVDGPVVVDTSAVVMGNVKSRSVQINNGAVIEGFCSQAYSEVDISDVFQQ